MAKDVKDTDEESGVKGPSGLKKIVSLLIAVALFLIIWYVPMLDLKELPRHVVALLAFTVTCWVLKPWAPPLTAMLFMLLAWLLGLAKDAPAALWGFSQSTPWFIWGGLIMALAVKETKLHIRIAYSLLKIVPPSTAGVLGVNYLLQFILALLIPSTTARVTATAPIAASQIESLGLPLKSRAGKFMMISLIMAAFIATRATLTGGTTQIMAWGILKQQGIYISWLQWLLYMLVPVVGAMVFMFIGYWLLYHPEPAAVAKVAEQALGEAPPEKALNVKEVAAEALKKMGPMTIGEKKAAGILLFSVLLWILEPVIHIDSDLVGIFMGVWVVLPWIGIMDMKTAFKKINWGNVVFVAAALSIGDVTEKSGAGKWLAEILKPVLSIGHSELTFLLLLLVLGFFGRLLLRSGAANASVLLVPTLTLAKGMGYHLALIGVMFPMVLAGIFIYQHTYGIIAYEYGTFEESDFIIASFIRYGAVVLAIILSYFLWWPLVGLI